MWQVVLSVRSSTFPSLTITTFSSEFLKQELKAKDQKFFNYKLKNFKQLHCFNFKFHSAQSSFVNFVHWQYYKFKILSHFYKILWKVLFLERTEFFAQVVRKS
jgi:hypothetical protein